ncbi:MAG: glycoside hydrolase family 2 TIM barrel-domain containing protein, partial [Candidatus Omnitrophota bacterium]
MLAVEIAATNISQDLLDSVGTQPPTFELKKVDEIYVPFQNGIPYPSWDTQDREYVNLNGTWKSQRQSVNHKLTLAKRTPEIIKLVEEEGGGRHTSEYDDSQWTDKIIPGVENPTPDRYQDGVWYRRRFFVPNEALGKYIKLMFESANYFTDVWINGRWIGCHEGGFTSFVFDVSQHINYGKENVIAVRVDNIPWLPDGDKSPEALRTNDHNIVPYKTCDWWNYGGITREVYLELSPLVSIVRADVKPKFLDEKTAELDVTAMIFNYGQNDVTASVELKVFATIIDENNIKEPTAKKVANLKKAISSEGETTKNVTLRSKEVAPLNFKIRLKNIKPWSPEEPILYVLKVSVGDKGKKLDEFYTQFGVREVGIDKQNAKLLFNGKEIFLRGIARHEVFFGEKGVGEVYGVERIYGDLKLLKEANANFVRTGHYPNQKQTYILADRLGLLIWEEIPVYWFEGPELIIQKNVRGIARQMMQEMVYRDYNRPSVIIWGTVNENSWQKERADLIRDLKENAYKIDGTRLVAQSASGSDPTDGTQKECDLLGFTTYYGVFYGSSYYEDTKAAMQKSHKAYPEKPILSTEYGVWSPYGDIAQEDIQVGLAEETFKVFRELPYACGATWWAGFDWHTMINEPQTMGTITMDRRFQKPIYFQLQRLHASLIGDLSVEIREPRREDVLAGRRKIIAKVAGKDKVEFVELGVDGQNYKKMYPKKGNIYLMDLDTGDIPDGNRTLIVRAKARKGFYVSDFIRVAIENIDEPPVVSFNLKDNNAVMDKVLLNALAIDDRSQPTLTYSVDAGEPKPMEYLGEGVYQAIWDVTQLADGSKHEVVITASDSSKNVTEKKATVIIDNKPGIYVDLPLNHDWISWDKNYGDGTGWDFPAEELPASNSASIYDDGYRVKFKFGDKLDGAFNNVESRKQKLNFAPGNYTKVHILASMHNGGARLPFILHYTDGTQEKKFAGFSDWWGGNAIYGEEPAIITVHHHEGSGDRKPGAGIYLQTLEPDSNRILSSITLPSDARLHIFAMTLEGEFSKDAIPQPVMLEPKPNSTVSDIVKIVAEDKEDDIAKVEYSIDQSQWLPMEQSVPGLYTAEWNTSKVTDPNHAINIKATDKIGQVSTSSVNVRVVNKVTILFPLQGSSIYKSANILVEPRANREVEKIEFQVDSSPFAEMKPTEGGLYTGVWKIGESYTPGSSHTLIVREYEKGGGVTIDTVRVTADSVKVLIAEPIKGHSIAVDKSLRDWTGTPPEEENTATVSQGEYIWKDAEGDDTGDGDYTYPTNKALKKGADLREFRV